MDTVNHHRQGANGWHDAPGNSIVGYGAVGCQGVVVKGALGRYIVWATTSTTHHSRTRVGYQVSSLAVSAPCGESRTSRLKTRRALANGNKTVTLCAIERGRRRI